MTDKKTPNAPEAIEDKDLDEASGGTNFAILLGADLKASDVSITDGTSAPQAPSPTRTSRSS